MMRHIVLVQVGAQALFDSACQQIATVADRLPGTVSFACGPSNSTEQLERGYTHGLVLDFVDASALRGYLVDPEHVAAGALLTQSAVGGRDGLLVVDLELREQPAASGTPA